jgi:hypothetical protein
MSQSHLSLLSCTWYSALNLDGCCACDSVTGYATLFSVVTLAVMQKRVLEFTGYV